MQQKMPRLRVRNWCAQMVTVIQKVNGCPLHYMSGRTIDLEIADQEDGHVEMIKRIMLYMGQVTLDNAFDYVWTLRYTKSEQFEGSDLQKICKDKALWGYRCPYKAVVGNGLKALQRALGTDIEFYNLPCEIIKAVVLKNWKDLPALMCRLMRRKSANHLDIAEYSGSQPTTKRTSTRTSA